ncbi:MAG: transketolase [Candidatus Eisenbacteria bacterium]|nr:transketolase [Candidatus Eisenbacteria bacterium]
MAIRSSKTGQVTKSYTVEELKDAANLMRGYNLVALAAAGSGHAGGTLSIMDITAALYLHVADHDPKNPSWQDRDRIIWSTGHKAPSLYLGLGMAGFCDVEDVVTLRKLYSPFQGHPHWLKLPGVEVSSGSLGQGLSVAVGMALAARLDKRDSRVYCIMGDGEQQEGQIWEAVMEAGHFKLDSLCGIIDKNRLQIDGWVEDVMGVDPLVEKYKSFNWNVIEIDGHNMEEIVDAFERARMTKGKPTLILADTVKGKGVSFMEDVAGWHGKSPSIEQMWEGLKELGLDKKLPVQRLLKKAAGHQAKAAKKLEAKQPKFSRDYFWNCSQTMRADMDPTRMGFGRCLAEKGGDERVVCLGADISGSITISYFYEKNPERKDRWISVGIAEQSGTGVCAGLAKEGRLPVFGTYGVFASGRNWDQLRTTVCYGGFNVFIAGAHGGVSVGPDGATHQALEEFFLMCGLPGMHIEVPCDAVETKRASEHLLFKVKGPKYLRFAREATPVVTDEKTPYAFGKANVIRFRGPKDRFKDAFQHALASKYKSEGEDLTIAACGPSVPEAMRAAWILKNEYDIETRVLNVHTVRPLDEAAIIAAAAETGIVVTAEEHQVGGFGNLVAAVLAKAPALYGLPVGVGMVGVKDRFGESGAPWELVKEFEVSAEHIAVEAKRLYDLKVKRLTSKPAAGGTRTSARGRGGKAHARTAKKKAPTRAKKPAGRKSPRATTSGRGGRRR